MRQPPPLRQAEEFAIVLRRFEVRGFRTYFKHVKPSLRKKESFDRTHPELYIPRTEKIDSLVKTRFEEVPAL